MESKSSIEAEAEAERQQVEESLNLYRIYISGVLPGAMPIYG
jgi:hypothetical protein